MTTHELYNQLYQSLLSTGLQPCSFLEFKLLENSNRSRLSLLDNDKNSLATIDLPLTIQQISYMLESLEYPHNPFGREINKCVIIQTGENRITELQKSSCNFKRGILELCVKEHISENSPGKDLGLTDNLINLLNSSTSGSSGLIICNGKQIESKLILQTLYPHWTHLNIDEFIEDPSIDKSFIYIPDHDPIALVTSILEKFSEKDRRTNVADKIKCVVSLISVKKQCGLCAKPTPIPQTSRNQFPLFLVEQVPTSYLFSRGCERCKYHCYKGLTFLESYFENRGGFLKQQAMDLNPEAIFVLARKLGLQIFHESALKKIKSGLTSLEQVLEHTPPIEQAFSERLNSCSIDERPYEKRSNTHAKTILIVEDDLDQREILQLVFSKEGFNVFTADNGKTALDVLKLNSVQIILSDIMMPVMNGLQLVRSLKSSSEYKNIPVLMLTASSNPDHEVKLLEEGADDYCAKNVKKKVLLTRVDRLLEKFKASNSSLEHLLT